LFKDQQLRAEYRPTMREVKISLTGWKLADAMGELRKWLDHHNCVPVNFDIERGKRKVLVVRILFADDAKADAFERDFGGSIRLSCRRVVSPRHRIPVRRRWPHSQA